MLLQCYCNVTAMYNTKVSLHSVLSQEQDPEKALFEIMKVKKIGDLSQSVLKQSNKETAGTTFR